MYYTGKIYLAGQTELTRAEVEEIYNAGKYICNRQGIFQVHYSNAQEDFYFSRVSDAKLSQPRRFYTLTAKEINEITGRQILNEE